MAKASKSFLKWAGGKTKVVPYIKEIIEDIPHKRLVEPFVGSGAVFLHTEFEEYLLGDINKDLINLFNEIKNDPDKFIRVCKRMFDSPDIYNNKKFYEYARKLFNYYKKDTIKYSFELSCLFIYLNRHGFNGMCRYNKKGEFNIPFGRYKTVYFPKREILNCYEHAKRATFKHVDYKEIFKDIRDGDIIYCDPPYSPISKTSSFDKYSIEGFSIEDHVELKEICKEYSKKMNIICIISNNITEFTTDLYSDADQLIEIQVRKSIAAKSESRGKVGEYLAVYKKENKNDEN